MKTIRRLEVRLSPDLEASLTEIAEQLGVSSNAVATMAVASYVRNWAPPWRRKGKPGQKVREELTWASGWSKEEACPADCGKEHDPIEHVAQKPGSLGASRVRMIFEERGLTCE